MKTTLSKATLVLALCIPELLYGQSPIISPADSDGTPSTRWCPWHEMVFQVEVNSSTLNDNAQATWVAGNTLKLNQTIEENGDISTYTLTIPAFTYNQTSNVPKNIHFNLLNTEQVIIATVSFTLSLEIETGTMATSHQPSSEGDSFIISWNLLPFTNSSNARYDLTIQDLSTETEVACENCRYLSQSPYTFTPSPEIMGNTLQYTLDFHLCPASIATKILDVIELKARASNTELTFEWTSPFRQAGGLRYEDVRQIIRLDEQGGDNVIQNETEDYSYTYSPSAEKVCSTYIFSVKSSKGGSPKKSVTAVLDLGTPEITINPAANNQFLVQWQSLASEHQIVVNDKDGVVADVTTDDNEFLSPEVNDQPLNMTITPQNCQGMSPVTIQLDNADSGTSSVQANHPNIIITAIVAVANILLRMEH